jgi:opacity protein-like surface antigen
MLGLVANLPKPVSSKIQGAAQTSERFVHELEPCVKQSRELGQRPPDSLGTTGERPAESAHKEPVKTVAVAGQEPSDHPDEEPAKPGDAPHAIEAWLAGGGSSVSAGKIDVPVQATFALTAGYPISITPQFRVHVGGAFTFTPVPYTIDKTATMAAQSKTGQLTAIMANVGATYDVIPRLDLRLDAGIGGLFFNASESQFTDNNPTSGALTMFHVRGGFAIDYAVIPNLVIGPAVALSYSPAKAGLRDDVKSFTSVDFMVGVGYRM